MNAERDDDAIAGAHRAAAQALDERPDPRVRAAVLAAAARAVDAKPHDAKQPARTTPFGSRRRGWALAAVLVVSVMTGVVATRGWRERPDLIDGSATRDVQAPPARPTASPPVAQMAQADTMPSEPAMNATPARPQVAAPAPRAAPRKPVPPPASKAEARSSPAQSDAFPKSVAAAAPRQEPENVAQPAASVPPAPVPTIAAAESSETRTTNRKLADSSVARSSGAFVASRPTDAARDREDRLDVEPASPQAWLVRVARLRAAGRDDDADREVEKLRARYPDFVVPREALRSSGTR